VKAGGEQAEDVEVERFFPTQTILWVLKDGRSYRPTPDSSSLSLSVEGFAVTLSASKIEACDSCRASHKCECL
jgi:hypothetical protein